MSDTMGNESQYIIPQSTLTYAHKCWPAEDWRSRNMNGEMAIISVLLGSSDRTPYRFQHSDATIYYPSTTNIPHTNYILSIRLTRDTIYYTFYIPWEFYSNKSGAHWGATTCAHWGATTCATTKQLGGQFILLPCDTHNIEYYFLLFYC